MSKINQIENKLLELEGGKFQKVCNAYLSAKGYSINSTGSVAGKDKTKKGTPDCFITTENGSFIFVEYTTEQGGVCEKFKSDIQKCLNEKKTKIPKKKLEKIYLFYNSRQPLSPEEQKQLYKLCKDIPLEIHGLSGIANDLYNHHRNIVRDELGIELDTGQIFTLENFIKEHKKSKVSTPLDNKFLYREQEVKALVEALNSKNLILLSGAAGVGKTKLALEVISRYKKNQKNLHVHCIKSHGQPLYEDIKDYLSKNGEHIVLVDDANRVNAAQFIFELTQSSTDNRKIKVIATVRDYALKSIIDKTKNISSVAEITIEPFKEEEIAKLLETACGITNHRYARRIWDISKGNPRIALMAGRVAKEKNDLASLRNLEAIYDDYFSRIREDLIDLSDTKILKVGGVISFFRSIDLNNKEQMELINTLFQISPSEFSDISFKLRDMEIVDAFDKTIKISDQVLSTYLVYLAVFKIEALSFSDLLNNFVSNQPNRIRDALYPCINTFDGKKISEKIEPTISQLWNKFEKSGDETNLQQLINLFDFMRTTQVLLYIKNKINETVPVTLAIEKTKFEVASSMRENFLLRILSKFVHFGSREEIKQATELLLGYAEKRPDLADDILYVLVKEFGIDQHSFDQQYQIQIAVLETLQGKNTSSDNKEFFAKISFIFCFHLLKTKHDFTESRSSRTVTFGWVQLPYNNALIKLRSAIWDTLETNAKFTSSIEILENYLKIAYDVTEKKALKFDAEILFKQYIDKLDYKALRTARALNKFLKKLDKTKIKYDKSIREKITSNAYDLLTLLIGSRKGIVDLGYEEFRTQQQKKIKKFLDKKKPLSLKNLVAQLEEIDVVMKNHHDHWEYTQGLIFLYKAIFEISPDDFLRLIKISFEKGDSIPIDKLDTLSKLFQILTPQEVFNLIERYNPKDKILWNLLSFVAIPEEKCEPGHAEILLKLYEHPDAARCNIGLEYLTKFRGYKKTIVEDIVSILVKKGNDDEIAWHALSSLFGFGVGDSKLLEGSFENDWELLKKAYFLQLERHGRTVYHHPRCLNMLLARDSKFMLDCINFIFEKEQYPSRHTDSTDYSFLWKKDNYKELIEEILMHTYGLERDHYSSYIGTFFKEKSPDPEKLIQERQDLFIEYMLEKHKDNAALIEYIFNIVEDFSEDRKLRHLKTILEFKPSIELFKSFGLLPMDHSWSGSLVPQLQNEIEFLEKIKSLLSGIDFLEHKTYVEGLISYQRRRINEQEKREFLEDF